MPNAKNNAKLTGDTHLDDVDDGDATPEARRRDEDEARPGSGENQADFRMDKDQPDAGSGKGS
jgi:hypothetical protein